MTPSLIFSRAAELIETQGWFQGMRVGGTHCHCAMTAIEQALGAWTGRDAREADLDKFASLLAKRLNLTDRRAVSAILEWNDADGRTKYEVIALLRDAAKEAA